MTAAAANDVSVLLIANRGEIALRIMRTARAMGLKTVAVYSDADAGSPHVKAADAAVRIGPGPASESYLSIDAILAAARTSGATAIHPGYGFLSENATFAQAVVDAGLVFVGPPPSAIAAMGDKARAKRRMIEAGIPCVPGYEGEDQSDATFLKAAAKTGYPVMIKASGGGGGRGMRLVHNAADLPAALQLARSEAQNAFGNCELILEKAILRPRHVEIQVFADTHGATIHLGERDCSVQRRHQKVIEESPCPVMTTALRGEMGAAAPARDAHDGAPGIWVPPRAAKTGEGGYQVHAAGVGDGVGERADVCRRRYHSEPVAEPLHGSAGDEDRSLEGVGHRAVGQGPGDRGEHPLGR